MTEKDRFLGPDKSGLGMTAGLFYKAKKSFVKFFKNMLDFAEDMSILCIDTVNTFAG